MEKQVYKCECGFVTHFEKALQAHCRFRKHKPLEVEKPAPVVVAVEEKPVEEKTVVKKTRKPRVKKTVAEVKE